MNQKEGMITGTLDLKQPREGQVYVIILMHTHLLKEL